MESGEVAHPIFFSGPDCTGNKWPNENTPFHANYLNNDNLSSIMCAGDTSTNCPVPLIRSMIMPLSSDGISGIQIQFDSKTTGEQNNNTISTSQFIAEYGSRNIYASQCASNGICTDIGSESNTNQFRWFSRTGSGCNQPGEENGCTENMDASSNVKSADNNCILQAPFYQTVNPKNYWSDDKSGAKFLQSMVSCGSNFYPSFKGVNVTLYSNIATHSGPWTMCSTNASTKNDFHMNPIDICLPGFTGTSSNYTQNTNPGPYLSLEKSVIQSKWDKDGGNDSRTPIQSGEYHYQACSCLGTKDQANSGQSGEAIDNGVTTSGGCENLLCGQCTVKDHAYKDINQCGANSIGHIYGSVEKMRINYVDENKDQISWPQLQASYCTSGVTVGGIPVQRYTHGSSTCDTIMNQVCINTATLTNSPTTLQSCACIIEKKSLEAQFSGLDLPVQCFSTICSLNDSTVYKTASELEGCSAKLCTQTLEVNGSQLQARGFQEIICNGEIYNVPKTSAPVNSVAFVSQPDINRSSVTVGPILYVSLAILGLLAILCIIWGIRKSRSSSRNKKKEKQQVQQLLLETINKK